LWGWRDICFLLVTVCNNWKFLNLSTNSIYFYLYYTLYNADIHTPRCVCM
jgi:hypothetical protein